VRRTLPELRSSSSVLNSRATEERRVRNAQPPGVAMLPKYARPARSAARQCGSFGMSRVSASFASADRFERDPAFRQLAKRGLFGVGMPDPRILAHLLFDPGRGLFVFSPVLLVGLAAIPRVRRALTTRQFWSLTITPLAILLTYAGYPNWHGGWTVGVRYLVPALPFLAFLLAFTFGMAATRFEDRRQAVLDEANAIGTTYLRTRLLPETYTRAARFEDAHSVGGSGNGKTQLVRRVILRDLEGLSTEEAALAAGVRLVVAANGVIDALEVTPFGFADVNSADGYDIDLFRAATGIGPKPITIAPGEDMAWKLERTPLPAGSNLGNQPDASWPATEDTITPPGPAGTVAGMAVF